MAYEPTRRRQSFTLRDGRKIAFCGSGGGSGGAGPILLCHGAPGSRLHGPDSRTTADAGFRLITVDRPGYGLSDPKPGRRIIDWPADVEELATALGLDEFDVAGTSAGGPYALACAYRLPQASPRGCPDQLCGAPGGAAIIAAGRRRRRGDQTSTTKGSRASSSGDRRVRCMAGGKS